MKKSDRLYLSAREASAELAISPATLYAYVSRGLIRSEPWPGFAQPSLPGRGRPRAEGAARAVAGAARACKSFDADLPVLDSAIATITEEGPIYRGVNCVDLAETRHAGTRRDAVVGCRRRRSVCARQLAAACPTRCARSRTPRASAPPIDRTIAVLALAASADPRAFTRAADGRALVGGRILRLVVATMLEPRTVAAAAASADRAGLGAGRRHAAGPDPPGAGAAGRS